MNLRELFLYKNFGPQGSGGGDGSGVTIKNQNKTFTENGTYKADSGYTGLGTVTVNVPETEPVLETLAVTENGEYTPGSGVDGFSKVTVNVETGGGGYSVEDIASDAGVKGEILLDFKVTRSHAFAFNQGITKVTLASGYNGSYSTAVTNIFDNCKNITEVDTTEDVDSLPADWLDPSPAIFYNCTNLVKVKYRKFCPSRYGFTGCENLEIYDSSASRFDNDNSFQNCKKLKTIILRKNELVPLVSGPSYWAFSLNNTPFDPDYAEATGGKVYVPQDLIEEYKVATNWSTIYEAGLCEFVAIEGSEYE